MLRQAGQYRRPPHITKEETMIMRRALAATAILVPLLTASAAVPAQNRPAPAAGNVVAKVDEVAMLRGRIDELARQLEEMKRSDAALKAELEKKSTELAFRATALESAVIKSGSDLKQFRAQFATHTHAMPNIGTINPASLGSASQVGVLWVPTSANLSVDLSRTGKPLAQ
jgi:septal ring factor EnvC (AmiA/AmiB activator)